MMIELAPWLAVIITAFSGIFSAIDKRIINKMIKGNAFTKESTYHFKSTGSIYNWRLNKLKSSGIICEIETGQFCFDREVYNAQRNRRRKILIILAALIIIYLLVANLL